MVTKREQVLKLFKAGNSSYAIHMNTGIGIKEVYNYIKESEEAKNRHRNVIKAQRAKDAMV